MSDAEEQSATPVSFSIYGAGLDAWLDDEWMSNYE